MDGRISLFVVAFAFTLSGCASTPTTSAVTPPGTTVAVDEVSKVKHDGPRQPAKVETEIKFGNLRESDADSDAFKKNPEAQARARDDARKAYQAALKIDPNNVEAARCLGTLYAKMGDFEKCFDTFKKSLAKHPKDAQTWYELGLAHNRRKDFNESVRCFNEAIKLDPENRVYRKTLGFTVAYQGNIDEGMKILTRVQGSAMAHYNIAQVLIQRDQVQPARQHLQIALRENAQFAEARELLAELDTPNTTAHIAAH